MEIKKQKKLAVINDLSGYGRCSLTVAIPIISAMKVQCCPVPTSILSNHTGFPTYYFDDCTDQMEPYLLAWEKLQLEFDGILTGFLGSERQIHLVASMIGRFKGEHTKVIIDPIMGDHGSPYKTYTTQMCRQMKTLVNLGDVVTPNMTEACILTETPYRDKGWKRKDLKDMARKIHEQGPEQVIITGIKEGSSLTNFISERDGSSSFQRFKKVGRERPGTGDIFASIIAADVVKGREVSSASKKAAGFVKRCIEKSEELEIPAENGVCFEELLGLLTK